MQAVSGDARTVLLERVRQDLPRVERRAERLNRVNTRLVAASLAATTLATLLAGVTAATGPVVGSGAPAWRWTCGVIAVVTALSGVLTAIHRQLDVAEHLAQALACAGRLRALDLGLTLGRRDPDELAREYEELLATHAGVLG